MDGLVEALMSENENEEALLRHFLVPAKPATLDVSDYPHVIEDVELLQGMLTASLHEQEKGVNVLVYGTPGSGKTELARLLAKSIGVNLFDEVEDVFPSRGFSFFGMEMKSGENKGWINKALEESKTPAIWICNQISQIDPAFLRRFDYAMELNTPPRSVRLNIVRSLTQVNELLVQMENFDGLFICSTNLMDDLDQASLRRFAIKVEFDYLKAEQAIQMLKQECITVPTPEDARTIAMLSNLAPGDFAAVKKRLDILGLDATPAVMIQELKTEAEVKQGGISKPIGFVSS